MSEPQIPARLTFRSTYSGGATGNAQNNFGSGKGLIVNLFHCRKWRWHDCKYALMALSN